MLCKSCEHYQFVEAKEWGTITEKCRIFGPAPYKVPAVVTKCSSFENSGDPWIFASDAWKLVRNNAGVIGWQSPSDYNKVLCGGVLHTQDKFQALKRKP